MDLEISKRIDGLRFYTETTSITTEMLKAKQWSPKYVPWAFEFRPKNTQDLLSTIRFHDKIGLTEKIINELNFYTKLNEVSKLEINSLEVFLSHSYASRKERSRIVLYGKGTHSFIDFEASDFKLDIFANDALEEYTESLIALAIGDEPK